MVDVAIKKHAGGRPTKYHPEVIIPQIEEYMVSLNTNELPTREGLAIFLNIDMDTVRTWSVRYPQFSRSIKKIDAIQKQQLMNDGMYGGKEVNPAMAIFLLKVNHGMQEAPQVLIQNNFGDFAKKELKQFE
jgi:hypothetical protein